MKRESLKQMLKKSGFERRNIHILDIIFIRINILYLNVQFICLIITDCFLYLAIICIN